MCTASATTWLPCTCSLGNVYILLSSACAARCHAHVAAVHSYKVKQTSASSAHCHAYMDHTKLCAAAGAPYTAACCCYTHACLLRAYHSTCGSLQCMSPVTLRLDATANGRCMATCLCCRARQGAPLHRVRAGGPAQQPALAAHTHTHTRTHTHARTHTHNLASCAQTLLLLRRHLHHAWPTPRRLRFPAGGPAQ